MKFYSVPFGTCQYCQSHATHQIRGPFNADYQKVCARHVKKGLSALEKTYQDVSSSSMPRS